MNQISKSVYSFIISLSIMTPPKAAAGGQPGVAIAANRAAAMTCSGQSANSKMSQACQDLSKALQDPCVAPLVKQVQSLAQSGSLQDSAEFCPNEASVASDDAKWNNVLLNFFAAVVSKESSGDAGSANTGAPTGVAKGYFQISADSVKGYKCCENMQGKETNGPDNARCGVAMNLQNMAKGDCWAHGGGGDANSCGVAKYQEVCREVSPKDKETHTEIAEACKASCESGDSGSGTPSGTTVPFSIENYLQWIKTVTPTKTVH